MVRATLIVGLTAAGMACVWSGACFNYDEQCQLSLTCPTTAGSIMSSSARSSATSGAGGSMSSSSSSDSGSTTSSGTGGEDSGPPPSCVPRKNPAAVADACGVFVSPTGSDTNPGTKDMPLQTLTAAVAKGSTIYACAGAMPYSEALVVSSAVTLYGGLSCQTWSYDAATKTALTAPADSIPLTVSNATGASAVLDFAITAVDAMTAGSSSIAVLDNGATLALTRCTLTAGKGADGAVGLTATGTGATGANAPPPMPVTALDGCVVGETGVFGGQPGTTTCGTVDTSGGPGGAGEDLAAGVAGSPAQPQPQPNAMPGADGLGGKAQTTMPCAPGDSGANGLDGATPGTGATGLGSLTASGYTGPAGTAGEPGGPGYGGGGGGGAKQCANLAAGPAGGGGGAGGCGGQGGGPGQSAGGSLALVSISATVSLDTVSITTADGGKGGVGGDGQLGGQGGSGGNAGSPNGDGSVSACNGGKGGQGGAGSPGGGGLGGHSAGIAFTGTAPTQTGVMITHGSAGQGGIGGDMNMAVGVVGGTGLACSTLDFTTPSNPSACTM